MMNPKLENQVVGMAMEWAERVRMLLMYRRDYRVVRNFAKADEMRDSLAAMGVLVTDTRMGQEVEFESPTRKS